MSRKRRLKRLEKQLAGLTKSVERLERGGRKTQRRPTVRKTAGKGAKRTGGGALSALPT